MVDNPTFGTGEGLLAGPSGDDILTRIRAITELTATEYSDIEVKGKAIPWALAFFNSVMDEEETVTDYATDSEDEEVDEILSWLGAAYAYKAKYPMKFFEDSTIPVWEKYMQHALELMMFRNPSKIIYEKYTDKYVPASGMTMTTCYSIGVYNQATETTDGLD